MLREQESNFSNQCTCQLLNYVPITSLHRQTAELLALTAAFPHNMLLISHLVLLYEHMMKDYLYKMSY